jgi:hypothetical protein
MKIEIKKITERIKNIIELKCNIDLEIFILPILYYFQVLSDSPQNKKKHFYFFPQNVEHP